MREFRLDTAGPAGDCAVLRVTGEVDVYTAPMLRERIRELAATGAVHLIADLGQVDFLDSRSPGSPKHSPPGPQSRTPLPQTLTGTRLQKTRPEASTNGAASTACPDGRPVVPDSVDRGY